MSFLEWSILSSVSATKPYKSTHHCYCGSSKACLSLSLAPTPQVPLCGCPVLELLNTSSKKAGKVLWLKRLSLSPTAVIISICIASSFITVSLPSRKVKKEREFLGVLFRTVKHTKQYMRLRSRLASFAHRREKVGEDMELFRATHLRNTANAAKEGCVGVIDVKL
ncbi:hypothetical protein B296_00028264 [Ensete ventricosum]|uniref:Uncharacterized protein n=1 Tax=Ensete ventricosum TaxID=4639 RepID=A0A426Y5A3_ENSVE|nr:hypothetical protein B296_00028264 [Ensete ventricosum]